MSTLFARLRVPMADALGVDEDEITVDSTPDTVPTWDSITHLKLVLALEDEFGIRMSPADIGRMVDVRAILALVGAKTGTAD